MQLVRDPIAELIQATGRDRARLLPAVVGAACVHAVLVVAFARSLSAPVAPSVRAPTQVINVDLPQPPPPPLDEPERPEEASRPALRTKVAAASPQPPAQAAAVLTKQPDPDQPVDLTGDSFVVGSASNYAGGETASNGTNRNAVSGNTGTPTSSGRSRATGASPGSGQDLSRAASIMGGSAWNCPFPAEADGDGVDNAVVTIRVDVSSAGTVRNVVVLGDPGHGFAREARRCATSKQWAPTLDHDGKAIQGAVTLRVRFDR